MAGSAPGHEFVGKDHLAIVRPRPEPNLARDELVHALTMAVRLARVTVSSRRTRTSLAFTSVPSRTRSSPTTPPVGAALSSR
jgi:hypothetical protein